MSFHFYRIAPGISSDFDCRHADLNQYFAVGRDAIEGKLRTVTYALTDETDHLLAMISLTNDYIGSDNDPESQELEGPAVKITALGVSKTHQRSEIGRNLIQFIQAFFVIKNKTGCRYMTVDAYNNAECLRFYREYCGFEDLDYPGPDTTALYYDLIETKKALDSNPSTAERYEAAISEMLRIGTTEIPFGIPMQRERPRSGLRS